MPASASAPAPAATSAHKPRTWPSPQTAAPAQTPSLVWARASRRNASPHLALCMVAPVLAFLELDDVYRAGACCRSWYAAAFAWRKDRLRAHGVPRRLRWRYWESCARVDWLFSGTTVEAEFERCLDGRCGLGALDATGTEGEILRDVTRTFPRDDFFSARSRAGQDMLADVLRATAVFAPGVNYCQGMNYVAAVMLLACRDEGVPRPEARAFGLLAALVCNLDMRDLWRPGVPQLKLRIFQFDRLLRELQPSLSSHFRSVGLTPDFFASQWFLTLLSINLPRHVLVRVWDSLLTDGWKTVFRVGIHLLRLLEPKLKDMTLEDLGLLFKTPDGPVAASGLPPAAATAGSPASAAVDEWVRRAVSLKGVSTRALVELESQYVAHILAQQLSDNPDIHGAVAFVDRRVAALVREEISRLDGPVRADVGVLRGRIEHTERALREARDVFVEEAREFIEVQADIEELQEAKRAVLDQIRSLSELGDAHEDDFAVLQAKVESVEAQLVEEGARFGGVLWRTAQAQVDLEEALERKKVFSEQLVQIVQQNEAMRTRRMKSLFRELNAGGGGAPTSAFASGSGSASTSASGAGGAADG